LSGVTIAIVSGREVGRVSFPEYLIAELALSALGTPAPKATFTLRAVRFRRQPSRANAPRPVAKSGTAAGLFGSCALGGEPLQFAIFEKEWGFSMLLFKFVGSSSAVLNMAKGALKFTPIEELNDPTELTPVMNRTAVRTSLKLLRTKGITKVQLKRLRRESAMLDLLSPEEKVIDAPDTLHEATRILKAGPRVCSRLRKPGTEF
jgi:hypothetical protein